MDNELLKFKKEFESIKNNKSIDTDKKDILYAKLMTQMESTFKIPLLNQDLADFPKDIINLYQEISSTRKF